MRKIYGGSRHIAIATVNRVDVLVRLNFKHTVNLTGIRLKAIRKKYRIKERVKGKLTSHL